MSSSTTLEHPPVETHKNPTSPSIQCDLPEAKLRRMVLVSLALLFVAYISRMTTVSHDMFHALALFRETLTSGWVPFEDVFAYTPTVSPSVHHEWGFGAILYGVVEWLGTGGAGLMAMKYALVGCVMGCCYARSQRDGASWSVFAILAPLMFPLVWVGCSTIRAQLFTLAFISILLVLLERDRKGDRWWLLAWIPLHCVWLNVHAGFVVGLVVYGFHCLETLWNEWADHGLKVAVQRNYHLPLGLVILTLCTWVNPYGTLYIEYLWEGLRMERPLIVEWRPLWHTFQPIPALAAWAFSVGLTVYSIKCLGVRRAFSCLLVLLAAYMAMKHLRHGSLYAVLWLGLVPAHLQQTPFGRSIENWVRENRTFLYRVATTGIVLSVVVMAYFRVWQPNLCTTPDNTTPLAAGAVDYLENAQFEGNLMTQFHAGAYISWKLYPAVKVSMDGRYEAAYPHGALAETTQFYKAMKGWKSTLEKYDTDAVLVMNDAEVEPELAKLTAEPDSAWSRVYRDDTYSIYAKPETGLPTVDQTGQTFIASFP